MTAFFVVWLILGGMSGVLVGINAEHNPLPTNQAAALGFTIFLFYPIVLVGLPLGGLWWLVRSVPTLARGYVGLWRSFFPKEVKLPEARIRE